MDSAILVGRFVIYFVALVLDHLQSKLSVAHCVWDKIVVLGIVVVLIGWLRRCGHHRHRHLVIVVAVIRHLDHLMTLIIRKAQETIKERKSGTVKTLRVSKRLLL